MTVVYNNEKYEANLTHSLLENLKKVIPDMQVVITEDQCSTYKRTFKVSVSELEDWSVVRNKQALAM